ncbi:SGNH/GDSL hydrolase family protein [Bacillus thermotolerans]|uniref:SGNH/GDSL hydrolase family protein n=1 Tax=Bacillus thermotolerans TaxID=1221996 RepID=UPI0005924248|nr:SGNH/GDSL hydrolase family protein [Bacillus thermotolerans]KKB33365.1 Lipase/Acylhydrolase [Bacillus thermotolerans]
MLRKWWIIFFALLFVTSGCSQWPNEQKEVIPKDLHIVSIGDSLTQGVGDSSNSGGYIPYLEQRLEQLDSVNDAQFENYGIKGNRTDQLLDRLDEKEVQQAIQESDVVVITIGGNDVMKVFKDNFMKLRIEEFEREQELYEERLHKIIQTVREQNKETGIVLIGLYNPFREVFGDVKEVKEIMRDWNAASKSIVEEYERTSFVAVDDIFQNPQENLLYKDQFHPNDRGYELIAERIFETIEGKELEKLTNRKIIYVNEDSV